MQGGKDDGADGKIDTTSTTDTADGKIDTGADDKIDTADGKIDTGTADGKIDTTSPTDSSSTADSLSPQRPLKGKT